MGWGAGHVALGDLSLRLTALPWDRDPGLALLCCVWSQGHKEKAVQEGDCANARLLSQRALLLTNWHYLHLTDRDGALEKLDPALLLRLCLDSCLPVLTAQPSPSH